ncbi:hypothetical protein PC113_g15666 [Phytophthora cactorum]|uniref:Uncharacterized protein n=1 Tax=Phytophthora cactorum TaxID=29920 RepID=A0A8T0YGJ2_9STRA|nr:hypothetical protein PC113_g15666 [Phytophthora cactorum]KAG2919364.1 hypothetical protein PC117_g16801 [Phytophthora cactorum]
MHPARTPSTACYCLAVGYGDRHRRFSRTQCSQPSSIPRRRTVTSLTNLAEDSSAEVAVVLLRLQQRSDGLPLSPDVRFLQFTARTVTVRVVPERVVVCINL